MKNNNLTFIFEANRVLRQNMIESIRNLSIEQLHKIPTGFNNNIVWNLGHVVASQQILCYKLGNAPLLLPENFIERYRKGTSPKDWTAQENVPLILSYFDTTNVIEQQYNTGLFEKFTEYQTSMGFMLKTIEDGIVYNYGHENLHYGTILNLRKIV